MVPDAAPPSPVPTATPTPVATAGPQQLCAYVTIPALNKISVIDLSTNVVTGDIPVFKPIHLAVSPNRARLYATGGLPIGNVGAVAVIDTVTNTVTDTVTVGNAVFDAAVSPDGARVYATLFSDCFIAAIIDSTTNLPIGHIAPGGGTSLAMAIAPDGATAYVAQSYSNTLVALDLVSNTVTDLIPLSELPRSVAITPDGALAYVATAGEFADRRSPVVVLDTATNEIVATVLAGNSPESVAISPDGRYAYVANSQSGTVSVIRTANNEVVISVPVRGNPLAVTFGPDGTLAYVATIGFGADPPGTLAVIDTATMKVATTVVLDAAGQDVAVARVPGDCSVPLTVSPTPSFTDTPAVTLTPTRSATVTAGRTTTGATSTRTRTMTRNAGRQFDSDRHHHAAGVNRHTSRDLAGCSVVGQRPPRDSPQAFVLLCSRGVETMVPRDGSGGDRAGE